MQATKQLSRSARAFFSGTFLSRLTGFGRDLAMAVCFGATPAVAAFMVAFRFANLARRLFGESPLSSSFIPHFETLRAQSEEKALKFFCDFFASMAFVLIALIIPTMLLIPSGEVTDLTRLMLPGLFFICLYGLSSAYLQCENRFFISSAAPIAFNAIWIFAVMTFRYDANAMIRLSGAVVIAFALQWLVSFIPILKNLSWQLVKSTRPFSPEVRAVMWPFALGILGVGASQINSALDALFARYACLEGPAYLWYAIRLQQLPLVLFGMAWSTALLPALSKERTLKLLQYAIEKCGLFLIPVTFALIPCAAAGVNLLFGHGDFTQDATMQTTLCLWGYGLGLFPAALVMMLAAFAFAQKNYRTPSIAAIISVIVNLFLNSLLVFVLKWGALSIAIATSISQIFNAYYLIKVYKPIDQPLRKTLLKTLLHSALAAFIAVFLYPDPIFRDATFPRTITTQLLNLLYPFGCYAVSFLLLMRFTPKRLFSK